MNVLKILKDLKAERSRLDAAINALKGVSSNGAGRPKTRTMSLAGRRRIAAAQKKRWAKIKRDSKRG